MTRDELRAVLHYEPKTGVFMWLVSRKGVRVGRVAGTLTNWGYWVIQIDGKRYRAHRLAFLYMTGTWPPDDIDHRNLDRSDNRWANLRPATRGQNGQNSKPWGVSKHKGVYWHKATGKWHAKATFNCEQHHLGLHDTEQSAAASYATFAAKHFPNWARLT